MENRKLTKKLTSCSQKKCGHITNEKKLLEMSKKCFKDMSKGFKEYEICLEKIGYTKLKKMLEECEKKGCKSELNAIDKHRANQWKMISKKLNKMNELK